jgi:hypothetical protein
MPTRSRKPADAASVPSFDQVADELYGLPPEQFTAARTRHEKQARQAGDRELAARVHSLAKPSVAAWLANQLVRERRDELSPLAQLGAGLREATEKLAGDELRQLSRQQHELVYALVQEARQLARAAGHSVSEDTARRLEDTLQAAVADQHAAEQLLAGRLTEGLHHTGFGGTSSPDAGATAREASKPAKRQQPRDDEYTLRAEHDLAEAERAVTDATKTRDDAQAQAADADQIAEAAEDEVERLCQLLNEASAAASEADRRRREQVTAVRQAEHAVTEAERRRAEVQRRRDRHGRAR